MGSFCRAQPVLGEVSGDAIEAASSRHRVRRDEATVGPTSGAAWRDSP